MYRNERRRGASHIGTALCGSQREVLCGSVASSLALLAAAALRIETKAIFAFLFLSAGLVDTVAEG